MWLRIMISNFIDNESQRNILVPNIKYAPSMFENNNEKNIKSFYEKNIGEFSGKDMANYQNDIEKNLKIEKLRLKNHRKYKQRLKSL